MVWETDFSVTRKSKDQPTFRKAGVSCSCTCDRVLICFAGLLFCSASFPHSGWFGKTEFFFN